MTKIELIIIECMCACVRALVCAINPLTFFLGSFIVLSRDHRL